MSGFWHRHKWTDWAVADRGDVLWHGDKVGWYLIQERHCLTCGKTGMSSNVDYGCAPRSFCERKSTLASGPRRKDGVSA